MVLLGVKVMNELDELLKMVKEKSYHLSGWTDVEVIEVKDLERIVNKLKEEIVKRYT